MSSSRIEVFEQMLRSDPENTAIMFGLAKEYEKAERHEGVVNLLTRYLELADDEGNAYGMLARAHERLGRRDEARRALERGIEVANAHGHPSMAEDYRMLLEGDD
ncbi:MAG TPA: tetratricopeptide repeat protein [Pyrinomonadaceae bacterium]|nr:tetratricopeptide repeat protein [Pyrinomonadaceae bacterium]